MSEVFLTAEETAGRLRLCTKLVRKLLREGKLPGRQLGTVWRVPAAGLQAYMLGRARRRKAIEGGAGE